MKSFTNFVVGIIYFLLAKEHPTLYWIIFMIVIFFSVAMEKVDEIRTLTPEAAIEKELVNRYEPLLYQVETDNISLLIIDKDGTLTGITDKTKLKGKVIVPAEVKKIDDWAFFNCADLNEVDFSSCTNLSEIGEWTFSGCKNLKNLDFSMCVNLSAIGEWAFYECSNLRSIHLPANLTEIGETPFNDISPDAGFTVPTEAVKKLLKGCGIKDEQITVKGIN